MNAKAKKKLPNLNVGVLFRLPIQQRKAIVRNLNSTNTYFVDEGRPSYGMALTDHGWNDVVDDIMSGKIGEAFYIKELTPRQVAQLYAFPTDHLKKMDWKPSQMKLEIRKHTKPLHDAWQEILSKEKKQWATLRATSELDVGIDHDAIPDKTQRDFMRELFMKHADNEHGEWILPPNKEGAIIKEYIAGEAEGVVVRKKRSSGHSASRYAKQLLQQGINEQWILDFTPVDKESDDVIDRVKKAIEKSGLTIKQIGTRCGVTDKHVYNWRNTGQIARQFLLPFARVTTTDAHPVTVDWILGGDAKEKASKDASGMVPDDPHWFRRPMMNADDEMVTETTRLIPALSAQQALLWDTQTRDFWTKAPEQFASVPTIDWENAPGSTPAFAYQMEQEGFGPDIGHLDMVLFSDDCLPRLGDFCMFKVSRYEDRDGKVVFVGDPTLSMGYFYPIGGKPDTTSPETYWKKIKGISLTENKDGSKGRYDEEYHLVDGWYCELIGVAIEIKRPLIGSRRMELVRGETTTEDQFVDEFFQRYTADEIADMIKESDNHQEIMLAVEKAIYDEAADQHAEMQLNERRGK